MALAAGGSVINNETVSPFRRPTRIVKLIRHAKSTPAALALCCRFQRGRPDQMKNSNGPQRMDAVTGQYCLKQINRAEGRDLRPYVSKLYGISSVGLWSTCLLDYGPHVF